MYFIPLSIRVFEAVKHLFIFQNTSIDKFFKYQEMVFSENYHFNVADKNPHAAKNKNFILITLRRMMHWYDDMQNKQKDSQIHF